MRYLLFRPGYLSHEYLRGRRADYLHPIRMYVFTSAVFFLIFFSFKNNEEIMGVNEIKPSAGTQLKKLNKNRAVLLKNLADSSIPSVAKNAYEKSIVAVDSDIAVITRDTTAKDKLKTLNNTGFTVFSGNGKDTNYRNVNAYDSIQKLLPTAKQDNFFERRFTRQSIHLKEKYHNNSKEIWSAILEKFKHLFPQMLFMSLPLFALVLRLLYIRRKNLLYVNHLVYSIHLYCATFIIILAGMGIEGIFSLVNTREPGWLSTIIVLTGFFFWYKSMRNFYEQRRAKTIFKYCLVLFMSAIIMVILFSVFFIFSAMSI